MENSPPIPAQQAGSPARAMKIGLMVILFVVFCLNGFCTTFVIPRFEQIYQDMLGGRPLPAVTFFMVRHHGSLFVLDLALLLGFLAALATKNRTQSVLIIIALIGIGIAQLMVMVIALFLPLAGTVQTISGNP